MDIFGKTTFNRVQFSFIGSDVGFLNGIANAMYASFNRLYKIEGNNYIVLPKDYN